MATRHAGQGAVRPLTAYRAAANAAASHWLSGLRKRWRALCLRYRDKVRGKRQTA